ncbi:MAG TPA: alpha/beta hydrolase [Acidimicrobiales bacterium]|nr:alpha/beta hydrolase [Acidimicrobiales bacterium]
MRAAPVDGATLHYEVVGEGPTCLVLSGWPGVDHTYLRPGVDRLARRVALVYYDHRCHGRSPCASPDSITVEQLADDADALAAAIGAGGVVALGHFHGASVAQELAIRHPGRVRGMILVGATPGELGADESLLDDLDAPPVPVEVDVLQRVPPATDDELAATLRALAPHLVGEDGGTDPEAVFAGATFDARAAGRWMQALRWWSSVDRLADVDVPALLVVGRHDVLCPPPQSERIRRRLGRAELVVVEGAGHLPWIPDGEAFAAAVEGWLDRLERLDRDGSG